MNIFVGNRMKIVYNCIVGLHIVDIVYTRYFRKGSKDYSYFFKYPMQITLLKRCNVAPVLPLVVISKKKTSQYSKELNIRRN